MGLPVNTNREAPYGEYSTLGLAVGTTMKIVSALTHSGIYLSQHPPLTISKEAKRRLAWFGYYEAHERNICLTCRHFGISRPTFYRWKARFYPGKNPKTLQDRPSRPKRRRGRTWTLEEIEAVRKLRRAYPRWGKDKLAVLLATEGLAISVTRVGRILTYLKGRGVIVEPRHRHKRSLRRYKRPYAVRWDRTYKVEAPGDLVEIDCLDVRPLPGVVLKQFTARDVVSRYDCLDIASRASAKTATAALERLLARAPFPVRAIQVDGGAEFMAEFEASCQAHGIKLIALPPRSPKLNGAVERANRTHAEEFYDCVDLPGSVSAARQMLLEWEHTYNYVRPHQALGYRTPAQFLADWHATHPDNSPDCN